MPAWFKHSGAGVRPMLSGGTNPPPKLATSVNVWPRPPRLTTRTRPPLAVMYDGSFRHDGCPMSAPLAGMVSGERRNALNSAFVTPSRCGFCEHPPVGSHASSPGSQLSMTEMLLSLLLTCAATGRRLISQVAARKATSAAETLILIMRKLPQKASRPGWRMTRTGSGYPTPPRRAAQWHHGGCRRGASVRDKILVMVINPHLELRLGKADESIESVMVHASVKGDSLRVSTIDRTGRPRSVRVSRDALGHAGRVRDRRRHAAREQLARRSGIPGARRPGARAVLFACDVDAVPQGLLPERARPRGSGNGAGLLVNPTVRLLAEGPTRDMRGRFDLANPFRTDRVAVFDRRPRGVADLLLGGDRGPLTEGYSTLWFLFWVPQDFQGSLD